MDWLTFLSRAGPPTGVGLPFLVGDHWSPLVALGLLLAVWIVASSAQM